MAKNIAWLVVCALLTWLDISTAIQAHTDGRTALMVMDIVFAAILAVCGLFYLAVIVVGK
jgi:hypothetical protein